MWSLARRARSTRLFAAVGVLLVMAMAALVAPGAASAERFVKCTEGTKINGEGSTLQEVAQKEVWAPKYNNAANKNKAACPGGPEVTYNTKGKTGSGQGMKNWYELKEFGPEAQAFVGTDNPPNAEIKTKIEAQQEAGGKGKLLTIPTLQAAIAIIVNLPTGCTAEAEPGTKPLLKLKRLVLGQKKLEEIFRRTVTKWSQITEGGDKLVTTTECTKAQQESEITRVVREDGSGTTATFKKWLQLVLGEKKAVVGTKDWLESAEEPPVNNEWPENAVKIVRGNGSSGVVKKVEETPGSIGYVNLANARKGPKLVPTEGGEGKSRFWVELENGQTENSKKVYTDPSTNGDEAAKAKSNCVEEEYVKINPASGKSEGKFPPKNTEELWNTVSAETKEKNYSLCGFTYDLGLTAYKPFKGTTKGEATTSGDYLEFVLNNEKKENAKKEVEANTQGGQVLIEENQDYLGDPTNANPEKNVLKIAQEGAKKIDF